MELIRVSQFVSEKEARVLIGWRPATMRLNRKLGRGPAFYRIGKRVFYSREDLENFIQSRRIESQIPPAA